MEVSWKSGISCHGSPGWDQKPNTATESQQYQKALRVESANLDLAAMQ
jgi:hypothetical protein